MIGGGINESREIVQVIGIWPYEKVAYAQLRTRLGEWDAQSPEGFGDRNWSPNLGQTTKPTDIKQKREPAESQTLPFW